MTVHRFSGFDMTGATYNLHAEAPGLTPTIIKDSWHPMYVLVVVFVGVGIFRLVTRYFFLLVQSESMMTGIQ